MEAISEDLQSHRTELSDDFTSQLKLTEELILEENKEQVDKEEDHSDDDDDDDDDQEEENEFSFMCGANTSPITAEDAFYNGQIRSVFPLFDRDLLLSEGESKDFSDRLPLRPPVDKVFIETNDSVPATSSSAENEDVAGPYCEWSKKAVEATPEVCKKSNSTGFSKLWRFRDFLNRSNSDGRDAFVFLNNPAPVTVKKEDKAVEKKEIPPEKKPIGEVKVAGVKLAAKKKSKSKTPLSAHEVYMRSKAQEDDRRRSYLPYRPELVGFFTNVHGGLSRNVHPF